MNKRLRKPTFILCVLMISLRSYSQQQQPTVAIRPAPLLQLPGVYVEQHKSDGWTDCNNAAHWDGDILYVFSSCGHPWQTSGPDVEKLSRPPKRVTIDNEKEWNQGGRWIEATYKEPDGKLYAWYHNEPPGVCEGTHLTAPRIGTMTSEDNGLNFKDLGIILEAPKDSLNCATANKYFVGGNGDFSVILDHKKEYFYFFISTYNKNIEEQGVAIARMRYEDHDNPKDKVWKWYRDKWSEPGLGGCFTVIFGAEINWHQNDAKAFWGPSIHWNTYLNQYVILLNLAKDKNWTQEGIYISFNTKIDDPKGWSTPKKIFDGGGWYPQVIGQDAQNHQTDKLTGKEARFFMHGKSNWILTFEKP